MTLLTHKPVPAPRHLLWIDGVGGFLLCLAPRITMGHAGARPTPDVPLLADVSRLHVALQRDAEGYALEAFRSTSVNNQRVERATLRSGDRITLGPSCQLVFSQPLPVSASARLDLVSGHRLAYPVSSVLLVADTLVLSGGTRGHVAVPGLATPIIVVRKEAQLTLRHDGKIEVDGRTINGPASLEAAKNVTVGEVSMTLERIG
jgi:hypothetical protein